jgi:DNA repair exonuclease SbcCD nuclease subunit
VIAILISDIHLSATPPIARLGEPDWLEAQGRVLDQVIALANKHDCRVLCAGDLFDRWNSPPAVINMVLERLHRQKYKWIMVPGQHDLPLHRHEDVKKSAYWTLVEAGVIHDLSHIPNIYQPTPELHVAGFGWGQTIQPYTGPQVGNRVNVAISHQYAWCGASCYVGATQDTHLNGIEGLEGYDVVVFGDNHKPWIHKMAGPVVVNPGCLIRRKQDERSQVPFVGLLREDRTVELLLLDTSGEVWSGPEEQVSTLGTDVQQKLDQFISTLNDLDEKTFDFKGTIRRYLDQERHSDVRLLLTELLEHLEEQ